MQDFDAVIQPSNAIIASITQFPAEVFNTKL